jgi:hypothetical protein
MPVDHVGVSFQTASSAFQTNVDQSAEIPIMAGWPHEFGA